MAANDDEEEEEDEGAGLLVRTSRCSSAGA